MLGNKKVFAAVGALLLAIGGGAYFYYVYLPQMQDETGGAKQGDMKSPVNPVPAKPPVAKGLPSASAVAAVPKPEGAAPAAPAPSAPTTVPATPQPVLAPAMPQPGIATPPSEIVKTAAPEQVIEPAPEPVKPAPSARKSASKNTKPVTMIEPMDSQSEAPALSREVELTPPRAPVVLPESPTAATFAPDTESKVIRPKYNDVMTAVLRGDKDAVKQLLDLGWWVDKPGSDGLTPLMAAVMNRDTQMVRLLLDHGAFPSSQALKLALERKDVDTASLLERRGAR